MSNSSQGMPKSAFVTGVAWVFIALSSAILILTLLQGILAVLVAPSGPGRIVMPPLPQDQIPFLARYIFENPRGFAISIGILSTLSLATSIGLLKRKNWARIVLIGILASAILWGILGVFMQFQMLLTMLATEGVRPPVKASTEATLIVIAALSSAIAIGSALLFGWLINRLCTSTIRAEFVGNRLA
jgi:hypothetical protein